MTHCAFLCLSDVQKFPLRMKDNDLLVTELYRDPSEDAITALSVYLTPKTSNALLSSHTATKLNPGQLVLIQLITPLRNTYTSACFYKENFLLK